MTEEKRFCSFCKKEILKGEQTISISSTNLNLEPVHVKCYFQYIPITGITIRKIEKIEKKQTILFCDKCGFVEDLWRFKEKFNPATQTSKYYCPKCKKVIKIE